MTSEVAVLNKEAIALAADSAVTFGEGMGQKIFPSASKIFTLSKYQPVGAMIYGNASHMGVPWETIFKVYRSKLDTKSFKTLNGYAENFLSYLRDEGALYSEEEEERYVKGSIFSHLRRIKEGIISDVQEVFEERGENDDITIEESTTKTIKAFHEIWRSAELLSSVPPDFVDEFKSKYGDFVKETKQTVFEELPLTSLTSRHLTEIAINLFVKFPDGLRIPGTSGVVIAGFGAEDIFPVLESFSIGGRIGSYLKHKRDPDKCTKTAFPTNAAIVPFAQSEMVYTFMTGVDPSYQDQIAKYINKVSSSFPRILVENIDGLSDKKKEKLLSSLKEIGEETIDQYLQELSDYRQEKHVIPVMSVVQALPKDELAAMAESLINLTSFKRRVSMEAETVGGPIDVAVISKGDGFIWIKRKHYFEAKLNPRYLANYFREERTHDTEAIKEEDTNGVPLDEGV